MSNVIIGCDNGISGALVAISAHNGALICGIPMPVRKLGSMNIIDAYVAVSWIKSTSSGQIKCVIIEACPDHSRQKSTMRSMAMSFGVLYGAISAGIPSAKIVTARSGNPKDSWQRFMMPECKAGETKPMALKRAKELWPEESFLLTKRSKVPDSGLIDAALLAEYARIKNL